jgi:hypothetical protein
MLHLVIVPFPGRISCFSDLRPVAAALTRGLDRVSDLREV